MHQDVKYDFTDDADLTRTSNRSLQRLIFCGFRGYIKPVLVTQQANALSEPQCAARSDLLTTYDGLGSIQGRGVGFSDGWTNSGHAMRLISRTGTEGLPVSSLNCDRPLHSGIRAPELYR